MLKSNVWYRSSKILVTFLPIVYRYNKLTKRLSSNNKPSIDEWKELNSHSAKSLYEVAVELEGLPIKMAQIISARADVMPKEITQPLSVLHDNVPPRKFSEIQKQIKKELNSPIKQIFSSIDESALGAASLAQVHRAKLKNGADVVIKVQYPNIDKILQADLRAMKVIVEVVKKRMGKHLPFDPTIFIDELREFLSLELNFSREAESTERIRAMFDGDERVRVPIAYRGISSDKMLVLEYLEGLPLTDIKYCKEQGVDLKIVAERIAFLFVEMIFNKGFFHGDPHPGNFLVLPNNVVGLLDFGLTKELPEGFGLGLATFMVKAMNEDVEGALGAARSIGIVMPDMAVNPLVLKEMVSSFLGDMNGPMQKASRKRLIKGESMASIQKTMPSVKDMKIPSHLTLVFRSMSLLNGLSYRLAPKERIIQNTLMRILGPHVMAAAATEA
ncbi:MAG: hypothetical protein KUG82_03225 [Pseudomonadales bacterium]|nr:hypothetical protein [Pseudomonadales bacterium]